MAPGRGEGRKAGEANLCPAQPQGLLGGSSFKGINCQDRATPVKLNHIKINSAHSVSQSSCEATRDPTEGWSPVLTRAHMLKGSGGPSRRLSVSGVPLAA